MAKLIRRLVAAAAAFAEPKPKTVAETATQAQPEAPATPAAPAKPSGPKPQAPARKPGDTVRPPRPRPVLPPVETLNKRRETALAQLGELPEIVLTTIPSWVSAVLREPLPEVPTYGRSKQVYDAVGFVRRAAEVGRPNGQRRPNPSDLPRRSPNAPLTAPIIVTSAAKAAERENRPVAPEHQPRSGRNGYGQPAKPMTPEQAAQSERDLKAKRTPPIGTPNAQGGKDTRGAAVPQNKVNGKPKGGAKKK